MGIFHASYGYNNSEWLKDAVLKLTQAIRLKQNAKWVEYSGTLKPTIGELYAHRARAYAELGEYRKSIEDNSLILRHFPANDVALQSRAIDHLALHEFNLALNDFNRYLSKHDGEPGDALLGRATAFIGLGQIEKADQDLSDYRKVFPDASNLFFVSASAKSVKGDFIGSIADLNKAISIYKKKESLHNLKLAEAALQRVRNGERFFVSNPYNWH